MKTKPTKPAAKKAPKLAPIVATGQSVKISWSGLASMLNELPTRQLKELLRARSLPIPKMKEDMLDALSIWARRDGGTFTIELR